MSHSGIALCWTSKVHTQPRPTNVEFTTKIRTSTFSEIFPILHWVIILSPMDKVCVTRQKSQRCVCLGARRCSRVRFQIFISIAERECSSFALWRKEKQKCKGIAVKAKQRVKIVKTAKKRFNVRTTPRKKVTKIKEQLRKRYCLDLTINAHNWRQKETMEIGEKLSKVTWGNAGTKGSLVKLKRKNKCFCHPTELFICIAAGQ